MTDNTIPLPEAIRALRDRPSMERELAELREMLPHCFNAGIAYGFNKGPDFEGWLKEYKGEDESKE